MHGVKPPDPYDPICKATVTRAFLSPSIRDDGQSPAPSVGQAADEIWGYVRLHRDSLDAERATGRIQEILMALTEGLRLELAEALSDAQNARRAEAKLIKDLKTARRLALSSVPAEHRRVKHEG